METVRPDILRLSEPANLVIEALGVKGAERDYLRALRADISTEQGEALVKAAGKLRNEISPDNLMSPEASDRLTGLILACDELLMFAGDQEFADNPGLREVLETNAIGLVDKKTALAKQVRRQLNRE